VELIAIHENCSGCGTCRLACAIENFQEVNPSKSLLRIEARFPAPGDYRNTSATSAAYAPTTARRMPSNLKMGPFW
jgi:Fe-S-cluster-containing dehydrogenase component